MKVGILGIGAIGSVIARCIDPLHDIFYFNRSQKSKIEIRKGDVTYSQEIILSTADLNESLDWLIICLKEYHYTKARDLLKSLITTSTKVAVIRNGINLKESILKYTSADNIMECIIDCPTQIQPDGTYHQLYNPIIKIGIHSLNTSFIKLFQLEQLEITEVEDYHTESWKKLIESSALGSILCLTGEACWIFRDEQLLDTYGKLIDEGVMVANAEGANISSEYKSQLIEKLIKYPKEKGSSMLTDRKNGQPIEVNAKNGIIAKIGKRHNIKTELNDVFSQLLSYINIDI